MTASCRNLVVGIGSAHGDDQAGWQVIDILAARKLTSARLRKAAVPHDLIDWIDDCHALHIVDACDSQQALLRCPLLDGQFSIATRTRSRSSHQFGIADVLHLAQSLQLLPEHVVLWAIPAGVFLPDREISDCCARQVVGCADRIQEDLSNSHAPNAIEVSENE